MLPGQLPARPPPPPRSKAAFPKLPHHRFAACKTSLGHLSPCLPFFTLFLPPFLLQKWSRAVKHHSCSSQVGCPDTGSTQVGWGGLCSALLCSCLCLLVPLWGEGAPCTREFPQPQVQHISCGACLHPKRRCGECWCLVCFLCYLGSKQRVSYGALVLVEGVIKWGFVLEQNADIEKKSVKS